MPDGGLAVIADFACFVGSHCAVAGEIEMSCPPQGERRRRWSWRLVELPALQSRMPAPIHALMSWPLTAVVLAMLDPSGTPVAIAVARAVLAGGGVAAALTSRSVTSPTKPPRPPVHHPAGAEAGGPVQGRRPDASGPDCTLFQRRLDHVPRHFRCSDRSKTPVDRSEADHVPPFSSSGASTVYLRDHPVAGCRRFRPPPRRSNTGYTESRAPPFRASARETVPPSSRRPRPERPPPLHRGCPRRRPPLGGESRVSGRYGIRRRFRSQPDRPSWHRCSRIHSDGTVFAEFQFVHQTRSRTWSSSPHGLGRARHLTSRAGGAGRGADQQVFPGIAGYRAVRRGAVARHSGHSSPGTVRARRRAARHHRRARRAAGARRPRVPTSGSSPTPGCNRSTSTGRGIESLTPSTFQPGAWTSHELDTLADLARACSTTVRLQLADHLAGRERARRDEVRAPGTRPHSPARGCCGGPRWR